MRFRGTRPSRSRRSSSVSMAGGAVVGVVISASSFATVARLSPPVNHRLVHTGRVPFLQVRNNREQDRAEQQNGEAVAVQDKRPGLAEGEDAEQDQGDGGNFERAAGGFHQNSASVLTASNRCMRLWSMR